jgi:hypothetical protein
MNILALLFVIFFLGGVSYSAYVPWFQPDKYVGSIRKKRSKLYKSKSGFFHPEVSSSKYMDSHPKFDLWLARVGSLVMIIAGIIVLLAIIVKP